MAELILDGRCQFPVNHLRADRMDDDPTLKDRESIETACYNRYANHYGIRPNVVDKTE